ncbi:MAG: hypothetical protein COB67_03685 [SAR324 cluster bacterium]|uniref:Type II secretion system protein GspH n=1 Tax=SAR324 cluster bacterium TaxID=2024889 RepID=A0A2A4T9B1_9DELT|nr:MAG: hypothetical protein COB67_03685 [SAR324 cluster bacterium]
MPTGKTQAGVTILELSLVMFIFSILIGFSLPRFSNLFESNLLLETKKIAKLISDLRLTAILEGKDFRLEFDTQKSAYSVLERQKGASRKYERSEKYREPIALEPPVEFYLISNQVQEKQGLKFGGPPLEFDKIFGQQFQFHIDSSGFIDQFTLKLKNKTHSISLAVVDIMGNIELGEETPL